MLTPVILSGGVGSRLWPLSRELNPKQFLPLVDEFSMLEQTLKRAQQVATAESIVVCNQEHRFMVAEQLRVAEVSSQAIILEPEGRNTAPAVAVAALQALKKDQEAILLVMPADHVIKDIDEFSRAVTVGLEVAKQGRLVTFGVVPETPETGYGYIRRENEKHNGCYPIAEFVEKPSFEIAQQYVESGAYYWNSGMFILNAQSFLGELEAYAPRILSFAKKSLESAKRDLDFIRLDQEIFRSCPSDSIDYAVMEKTNLGAVIPLDCGWSDVGSWSSLWDIADKDENGNASKGDTLLHDTRESYIHSTSRLVTAIGLEGIVVVETSDALLVAKKDNVQDVKLLVNQLSEQNRLEANRHTKVYRPWGSYETLVVSDRFQVKRIIVNPKQQLSLQLHHHRAEHWVVVSGTALVTCGDEEFILSEDQSTYIPLGIKHRLANTGIIPIELIEVQSGSYLGEDDIVRFEDVYGRDH